MAPRRFDGLLDLVLAQADRGGDALKLGAGDRLVGTEVLKYADRETSISPKPYLMWQVCSGFAHGRQWANLSMNDLQINPTAQEGISAVRSTSDYKRLLTASRPASLLMIETVWLLTERSAA